MRHRRRIIPTPGYRCRSATTRIFPRPGFSLPTLHTRALPQGSPTRSIEAEWCPVCLGKRISERVIDGKPIWHCEECGNEW